MIIDSIRSFERCTGFHHRFQKVYEYLRKTELINLEPGEYPVDGKEIVCKIWAGEGKGINIPKLEIHDSYIDIHILLEGAETIGHKDRALCNYSDSIDYDESEDIAFIDDDPENFINLGVGNLAIMFPRDAHAPLIGDGPIKKAIIKVLA